MVPKLIIIYASQSGNSKHVAEIIKKEMSQLNTEIYSIDEFSLENLLFPGTYIMICSTYGNGDFPFCAQHFYNVLVSGILPKTIFKNTNFAIFGLGDSSYVKFNFASQKLYAALKNLGGNMIVKRGVGNVQDKDGYYTALYPWISDLRIKLKDIALPNRNIICEPKISYQAKIISKKTLTPEKYKPAMLEIGFDIDGFDDFEPGDAIAIRPENTAPREFLQLITNADLNSSEMAPNSQVIQVLKEIGYDSLPFYYNFKQIYDFLENSNFSDEFFIRTQHKEPIINKIKELSTNFETYYTYIKLGKRSFIEVFRDLGLRLPFEVHLRIIPKIVPRYFTLTKIGSNFYLTITLVDYEIERRNKKGLCSRYLEKMEIGHTLICHMVKSHLDYTKDKLLFICTGAGITLARSFWQYCTNKKIVIFFGHRYNNADKIYAEEISKFDYVTIYYAPSRDTPQKYVQKIFEEKFSENIHEYEIFVSGRTRLNREVREMFRRKYGNELYFQAETW